VVVERLEGCGEGDRGILPVRAWEWHRERLLRARYKHPSSVMVRGRRIEEVLGMSGFLSSMRCVEV